MKTISRASSKSNGPWYPAAGGKEKPFRAASGARLLYVFQPSTGRHAYLDVRSDVVLSDADAESHMARRGVKGNPVKKAKSKSHTLAFGELPRGPRSVARPQLDLDLIRRVQADERRRGPSKVKGNPMKMPTGRVEKAFIMSQNGRVVGRLLVMEGDNASAVTRLLSQAKSLANSLSLESGVATVVSTYTPSEKRFPKFGSSYSLRRGKIVYVALSGRAASSYSLTMTKTKAKAKRLSNPVYDALIPNPVKIPFKLMQPRVSGRGLKTINARLK